MSPRTIAQGIQDHYKTIVAALGMASAALFALQSLAWGFVSPAKRVSELEQQVEALESQLDSLSDGINALLIDRCLDPTRSPDDLARMRINCRTLLNQ